MPPFDVGLFRVNFPEFADTVKYPAALINNWAGFAIVMVNQRVWKPTVTWTNGMNLYILGVSLYAAHEIVIAAQSAAAAAVGGVPGTSAGIANNKTVGSVSVGYDAGSTTEPNAGYWNQTTYGKQFIRLARIFGAGAIQL